MEKEYVYEYLKGCLFSSLDNNTAASLILKRIVSQLDFDPFFSDIFSENHPVHGHADNFLSCFIDNYMNPSLKFLNDPFLITDMDKAVVRITKAILEDEAVCIYGDYDVDGITATSFLVSFLRELKKLISPDKYDRSIFFKLPDRIKDGYGLSAEPIDEICDSIKKNTDKPLSLLITVDLGITDTEEVSYANSKNIDVIICDHHEVPVSEGKEILPEAIAVLNPKRKGDKFPFKFLPGVGIAFYLGIALRKHLVKEGLLTSYPNLKDYLDIICLGIIADIVPMYGDNRTLTYYGLKILNGSNRPGIKELKRICGIYFDNINESDVAWKITPKINAAGRVGNPEVAVKLLTQRDPEVAYNLAQELEAFNKKRHVLEDNCFNETLTMLSGKETEEKTGRLLVLEGTSWHPGVIGIVSSKLAEYLQRPVLLLTGFKDSVYIGSARSCGNIDIYALLKNYERFFLKFGGHKMACGLTIEKGESLHGFVDAVKKDCPSDSSGAEIIPNDSADASDKKSCVPYGIPSKADYDEEITLRLLSDNKLSYIIKSMSPYGPLNEQPKFLVRNITLLDINRREFKNRKSKKSNFSNCYFTLNIEESSTDNAIKHRAMMFNRHKSTENILGFNDSNRVSANRVAVDGIIFEFFNGYIKILNFI